ncbi:MAG: FAD-dependent oxidoreductase [Candidatus Aquicultorales bacterium]
MQLEPGGTRSLWIATTPQTYYPPLESDLEIDVLVVGAGIVGLTTAYLLSNEGLSVAVIESDRIVAGVTGHTTAKLTALQGSTVYQNIVKHFGAETAKAYAVMNVSAIQTVESLAGSNGIACDFERTTAYTFTESEAGIQAIGAEARTLRELGFPAKFSERAPLPFETKAAVSLAEQAQFHPRKYLLGLAEVLDSRGVRIFERTRAVDAEDGEPCVVRTELARIEARHIVMATTFPFFDKGVFFARLYPGYSYAVAFEANGPLPDGHYYSEDGIHHSLRTHKIPGKTLLIVGGGDHKTGQGGSALEYFEWIEAYARERFDLRSADYHWSTEDYDTPDGLPFIGRSPGANHIYMAVGFAGWGMTNGTAAASIIADLVAGRVEENIPFLDPSRKDILVSGKRLVSEGLNIAKTLGAGLLEGRSRDSVSAGEASLTKIKGGRAAVYKAEDGTVYARQTACPHMGCALHWNDAELTWDCPCHGSRFKYDGYLIHGPAVDDLAEVEMDEDNLV